MNRFYVFLLVVPVLFTGCTTSNTKIKSFPKHIGYRMHEKIVHTPITGISEYDNEQFMNRTNSLITEKLIFFNPVRYYDALYQTKQHGMNIPTTIHDTTALYIMYNKLGIHYIIAGSVTSMKEYYIRSENSSEHIGKATLSLYVIDTKNKAVVWQSSTRTTQSPIEYQNNRGEVVLSGSGNADTALGIAYRKSIRKMIKAFEILPNRR